MKPVHFFCACAFLGIWTMNGRADGPSGEQQSQASSQSAGRRGGFLRSWFKRVAHTQAEQPHWVTPVVTVTPRLEQEFRYDFSRQTQANGTTLENYGGSKGLELIPIERAELILGVPPYLVHNDPNVHDGFGDVSFLLKYRLLSANEENGNYILTVFLGATAPTGSYTNGAKDATITPTIAAGKGWGNFDVQSTVGVILPTADTATLGRQVQWNTAFQYRVFKKLWPELEVNSTFFQDGANGGKKQVFLTPGIVVGKFPIWHRLGITLGGGVQIAATQFHTYNNKCVFSIRFPF